jgi:hypothetical protein
MIASRSGQDHPLDLTGVRDIARQGSIFVLKPASRSTRLPSCAVSGVALQGSSDESTIPDIRRGDQPADHRE